ncbi:GNAT family N-acetyltransferase [Salinicola sp. JS01]|uniref:GNAT family N-acetyltransferase n=1 Tax=Salinicola sp. JS01 TaxID=3050071 RepID=UPI00255BF27F|nr:GNAT family N-acetyltransferase [Salinicola sp. JS01]WIX32308.1 GNAT family N-acetyltransferase [Salinicola sp. JS01]
MTDSIVIADTGRLRMRGFQPADIGALSKILADAGVMRFSLHGPYSTEKTRDFIAANRACQAERDFALWALEDRAHGVLLGFCGLSQTELNGRQEIELGYRLARRAWGTGLATEAASAALRYGFEQCGLDSIIAIVDIGHRASARVAQKTGMRREARSRYHDSTIDIYRRHNGLK